MSDTPSRSHPADSAANDADDIQRALQAVQIALDRRDNGGDAGTSSKQALIEQALIEQTSIKQTSSD